MVATGRRSEVISRERAHCVWRGAAPASSLRTCQRQPVPDYAAHSRWVSTIPAAVRQQKTVLADAPNPRGLRLIIAINNNLQSVIVSMRTLKEGDRFL